MNLPVQIAFRNVGHSETVEAMIRERVSRLERFYGRIMGCRVLVEAPHRHRRHGRDYRCRIDVTVPNGEIVVCRDPAQSETHEDLYTAIDTAFDVAQRRLEDTMRRQRGDVKTHEASPRGRVVKISRERGFGFLETPEGYEVYFHRHSVLAPGFDALQVGATVRYVEELGDMGPQASTVAIVRRSASTAEQGHFVEPARRA